MARKMTGEMTREMKTRSIMQPSFFALTSLVAVLAAIVVACGGKTDAAPVVDANDDTGSADTGPTLDTGGDALEDADEVSSSARRLITVPLFEGIPSHDRFVDPAFEMSGGGNWFVYGSDGGPATTMKHALARAPQGQTTLLLPGKPTNPTGVLLLSVVKLSTLPQVVTVWIGGAPGDPTASASMVALDQTSATLSRTYRLTAEKPDTDGVVDLDGLHWVRWRATLPAGLVGFGLFIVTSSPSTAGTYVHAPDVELATASMLHAGKPTLGTAPNLNELHAASLVAQRLKEMAPRPQREIDLNSR